MISIASYFVKAGQKARRQLGLSEVLNCMGMVFGCKHFEFGQCLVAPCISKSIFTTAAGHESQQVKVLKHAND